MKPFSKFLCLAILLSAPAVLPAQGPELSADEPIAYREAEGLLIATGNAVFVDENTRVEADTIRYNRDLNRIEAEGHVQVTRIGLRLLSEHLIYEADTKRISSGPFRAGYPPLFIEGESFTGTVDEIDFSKVSLYFREPVENSPRLELEGGTWKSEESVTGHGLRLNTIGGLKVPLPGFEYTFGTPTADVEVSLGYRNRLGAYLQSAWLYPFSRNLAAGGNFDLYSKRGILVGPAFEWKDDGANLVIFADTGWIHDHSSEDRGVDIIGRRIEQDRGFGRFSMRLRDSGNLQFQGRLTYLSDSEVLRDFRHDLYFYEFQPDNFADFTWQQNQFLVNVFARRQLHNFHGVTEKLPEVRVEWLPSEIADTGLYLQASAAAQRYRLKALTPLDFNVVFPDNPLGLAPPIANPDGNPWELYESPYYNRLDGALTLTRPIYLPGGVNLILRAGGRWTDYSREESSELTSASGDRLVGELGFDLNRTMTRTYRLDRPRWNIEKLRHTTRVGLQHRWHPGAGEDPGIAPPIELYSYHARRPVLDLADLSHTDGLREWNVTRIGWENLLTVAGEDGQYRDFLAFNLYQDLLFSADPGEDEWDALYAEADFTPLDWMTLSYRQKYRPEDQDIEAYYLGVTLRSADLWSLRMEAEYLQQAIEQYRLSGWYRVSENLGLTGYWQYDARLRTWTRQQYGITRRFGNVWQMELYFALNDENDREDDFSVGLRLDWLSF